MVSAIPVRELRELLRQADQALALVDVRETAEYNLAHIAGSCSLPRRQIEFRMTQLVPWRGTRVVVCDDDGVRAGLAAGTLEAMGYREVSVLTGGLNRWVTEGESTEWGLNVPSKDFGEKVLLQQKVAEVEPDELAEWMKQGKKLVILDSRTPEEHQRACIPGSRSMPGAELGLRVWDLVEDPEAQLVVHCAGRTRSIIGAGSLRRLGLPAVALKNGTMGWQLAGLQLETGSNRLDLPDPSAKNLQLAEARARAVAQEEGVRYVDVAAAQRILARSDSENVYALDVRGREEFAEGHVPGFRWVPGGQAVQAWDSYIAVRAATILLSCDGIVRASMTGSWFRQMGFENVFVIDGGTGAWQAAGLGLAKGLDEEPPFGLEQARNKARFVTALEIQALLTQEDPPLIFVGTSEEFSRAHIEGSTWLSRSWLEPQITRVAPDRELALVLTCPSGVDSTLAAGALYDLGYRRVLVLDGGMKAWQKAGLPVTSGLEGVTQAPNDVLAAQRPYAEMLNYLRWEEALGEKYRQ